MRAAVFFVLFCIGVYVSVGHVALAQTPENPGAAYPNDTVCPVPLSLAPGPWSAQEHWAWDQRICLGLVADLSERPEGASDDCDVATAETWPADRVLSPAFVQTVMFHEPYRSAYTSSGFRVLCARFDSSLDLRQGRFAHEFWIEFSYLHNGVVFFHFAIENIISFEGSRVSGDFIADGLHVGGSLFMSSGATFQDVNLVDANIGGVLDATGSTFEGKFNADGLHVGGSLFMRGGATFQDVDLIAANIGGNLDLRDSTFGGTVNLSSASIGNGFLVGDENRFAIWQNDARLILRNLSVGSLQAHRKAWDNLDNKLDLVGFTYERLGGLHGEIGNSMADWDMDDLQAWLGKQQRSNEIYFPQPYQQLADVLRAQGFPGKANKLMIAKNNRHRATAPSPITKALLWLEWAIIGYGYRSWRALVWLAALIAFGAWAAKKGEVKLTPNSLWSRFWYSTDRVIPALELDRSHTSLSVSGWPRRYFYIHHIVGFLLIALFIAGLTGLAK